MNATMVSGTVQLEVKLFFLFIKNAETKNCLEIPANYKILAIEP